MVKTVIGVVLIIIGCLLLGVLLSSGKLFPHIIGPITLEAVGITLLALKRKGSSNE